jgi:hypothetical protein
LLEDYLKWLEGGNGKIEKFIKWVGEKLNKVLSYGGAL